MDSINKPSILCHAPLRAKLCKACCLFAPARIAPPPGFEVVSSIKKTGAMVSFHPCPNISTDHVFVKPITKEPRSHKYYNNRIIYRSAKILNNVDAFRDSA